MSPAKGVEFSPASLRDLRKIHAPDAKKVADNIGLLLTHQNPLLSPHVRKLRGTGIHYRLRSGDYRVVFKYAEEIIRILRIYSRKDMNKTLSALWS